ncbi:MAG: magnesium/cobalt transporter CorA [Gemmatimonadaceae bacterium]
MLFRKRNPPVGSRPGTLVIPAEAEAPTIRVIAYSADTVDDTRPESLEDIPAILTGHPVTWVDIQGLGDERLLRRVAEMFNLHPLALEDAVNVPQRPKSEMYEHHYLYITRMTMLRSATAELETEQVSIFLGRNYVLTLQERCGDVFDPVRSRVHAGIGAIRHSGPDYLAYALIDTIIDGYYPVLEQVGERLEGLEEKALATAQKSTLREIYDTKRQLLNLRRAVWPQREAVNSMIRDESPLITPAVRIYLRDCYDHTVQLIDVTETFRELCGNLLDLYMSSVSMRTNDVMKLLTIMSSIFIPLTFLAGIYGMNFDRIPELHVPWAYPALLLLMGVIGIGMLFMFWKIGWIGDQEDDEASADKLS